MTLPSKESLVDITYEGRDIYLPPNGINPKVIIDVGCFTGITTAAYSHVYPDALVYGYELEPGNYATALQRDYEGQVFLKNKAVWVHNGTVTANLWGPETHHIEGVHPNAGRVPQITVPCTTLDAITYDMEHVDFIKMDIEGAEHSVLTLGGEWVKKTSSIFVEIHDVTNDNIRAMLQNLGFEIVKEGFEIIWGVRK